jgi:TolB-like protein/lipopolysaccharide biosynthesis regulator YciM
MTKQLSMLAFAIGLPIALTLAWYHGDRGQQRMALPEIVVLALVLLVGGGLLWLYAQRAVRTTAASANRESPAAVSTDARPSIAILPFENRSRLADDEYFVDGIHDDILTQLSKVSALRVISRTSVEQFRENKLPTRTIADQLGVTRILEGGVQRAGDRVRIHVQLIDAASDAHLWAESHDRELTATNIFEIQSEVASSIAHTLRATLTPVEQQRIAKLPTRSLEAWKYYQLGRRRLEQRNSAALADAEAFFQKAIKQDPNFALAFEGLAETLRVQFDFSAVPLEETIARAEAAAARALALDPNLAGAHATAGAVAMYGRDNARAEAEFRRALEINPNYATARMWYGNYLAIEGRYAEALEQVEVAAELDPLSSRAQSFVAQVALRNLGRFDEAMHRFDRAVEIDPSVAVSYAARAETLAYGLNRWAEGDSSYRDFVERDPESPIGPSGLARLHEELDDDGEAWHWLQRLSALGPETRIGAEAATLYYAYRGEFAQAESAAKRLLTIRSWQPTALRMLRDADLRAGKALRARVRYATAYPELFMREVPALDLSSARAAIDLALVLRTTGEDDRARVLLDRAEEVMRRRGPMSQFGYSFSDAEIQSLRGRRAEALVELRQALQQGRRAGWRYHRDFDPNLESIRNEPEFKAIFAEIERDMVGQRAALATRPKEARLDLGDAAT